MKALKNILVGFLVSFVGSIPLGYLNIVGFEIYSKFGMNSLFFFLLGIISVEVFVIYFTLIFANSLVNNKKLMKAIEIFAIFFLLILAYSFYSHSNQSAKNHDYLEKYVMYSPFLIGIFLNLLNFLQVPFWTGWNLYLINSNYISVERKLKYFYIVGTLIGTFLGMIALILSLHSISKSIGSFTEYVMPVIIPLFFVVLAVFQMYKVYEKYFSSKKD
ncbi:MAG: LysE family transporter [Flavobacterium sp.]|uniref:LysE family transporter n=1 Tax=Flavobacterium sp. TaxID=239 RepID=UPI002613C854|nr:LysE family transporter [Flavobacterium sp.]MDD5151990.1 LysE family transporter [Flavobacterium sp.]